jgi:hypothetical protein
MITTRQRKVEQELPKLDESDDDTAPLLLPEPPFSSTRVHPALHCHAKVASSSAQVQVGGEGCNAVGDGA